MKKQNKRAARAEVDKMLHAMDEQWDEWHEVYPDEAGRKEGRRTYAEALRGYKKKYALECISDD